MTRGHLTLASKRFGAVASALYGARHLAFVFPLILSAPVQAGNGYTGGIIGGIVGGIVGGAIIQQQQQQNYQQQQQQYQYYQQQLYYRQQQQQQQQQQYYQQQQDAAREEARQRHQAEAKKKAEQEKQGQANLSPPAADIPNTGGPISISMKHKNGILWVPTQINGVVAIDFIVDSGAADVTIPKDVVQTLIRSGTLTEQDIVGDGRFSTADGSEVRGVRFKLAKLQVGNQVVTDVIASVIPSSSNASEPLLGQTFLSRFQSWTIDNNAGALVLTLPGGGPMTTSTVQTASAAPSAAVTPAATTSPKVDDTIPQEKKVEVASPPASAAPPNSNTADPEKHADAKPDDGARPRGDPPVKAAAAAPTASPDTASEELATAKGDKEAAIANTPPANVVAVAPAQSPGALESGAAPAKGPGDPIFPKNTPYGDARRSLMALGYGPASLPDADKCDRSTDKSCFPERVSCNQSSGVCEFLWKRGERLIKVTTALADPPTVSAVECQVNCQ